MTTNEIKTAEQIAKFVVYNELKTRIDGKATALNAGIEYNQKERCFYNGDEKICRIEAVGRLAGTCKSATNTTNGTNTNNYGKSKMSQKRWQKLQAEAEPIAEGTNFFIDLFRAKEQTAKVEAEKNAAKIVLHDELSAKDDEIAALKAQIAAYQATTEKKARATKKATKKAN